MKFLSLVLVVQQAGDKISSSRQHYFRQSISVSFLLFRVLRAWPSQPLINSNISSFNDLRSKHLTEAHVEILPCSLTLLSIDAGKCRKLRVIRLDCDRNLRFEYCARVLISVRVCVCDND